MSYYLKRGELIIHLVPMDTYAFVYGKFLIALINYFRLHCTDEWLLLGNCKYNYQCVKWMKWSVVNASETVSIQIFSFVFPYSLIEKGYHFVPVILKV